MLTMCYKLNNHTRGAYTYYQKFTNKIVLADPLLPALVPLTKNFFQWSLYSNPFHEQHVVTLIY